MNPSTALATVLVDELVRGGVRDAVLAPGSRSAPLAFALHAADADARLRLHVRIDERSAGFLALGLAKGRPGSPVAVVTTSGTAVANLHPAVLEAHHSGVPLVVMTADRPPELRETGANQTTDQIKIFGSAVRLFHEVGVPEARPGQVAYWRALACRVLAAATGAFGHDPGPVHLNLAFREPLVPDASGDWVESLSGRTGDRQWTAVRPVADGSPASSVPSPDDVGRPGRRVPLGPRTVVLAGDGAGPSARLLAEHAGWPLLAEPTSGSRGGPNAVATYRLLLGARAPLSGTASSVVTGVVPGDVSGDVSGVAADIERVIVFGRPTLSRPVTRLLSRRDLEIIIVSSSARWPDVGRQAAEVVSAVTLGRAGDSRNRADAGQWLQRWLSGDAMVRKAIDGVLAAAPVSGPAIAQTVAAAVPPGGLLVVGSSNPIRDLDLAPAWDDPLPDGGGHGAGPPPRRVIGNRGASGIDGTVSTAIGAALAVQSCSAAGADAAREAGPGGERPEDRPLAYALVGDLTFLHDATGLVIGPADPRPDLCIVVVNDDGGGIFSILEQGSAEFQNAFERVFGTPHGVDLAALCAATGTSYELVRELPALAAALDPRAGLRVVEVRTDRGMRRELNARLTAAAHTAIARI